MSTMQVGQVAVCTFDPLWPACKHELALIVFQDTANKHEFKNIHVKLT